MNMSFLGLSVGMIVLIAVLDQSLLHILANIDQFGFYKHFYIGLPLNGI